MVFYFHFIFLDSKMYNINHSSTRCKIFSFLFAIRVCFKVYILRFLGFFNDNLYYARYYMI